MRGSPPLDYYSESMTEASGKPPTKTSAFKLNAICEKLKRTSEDMIISDDLHSSGPSPEDGQEDRASTMNGAAEGDTPRGIILAGHPYMGPTLKLSNNDPTQVPSGRQPLVQLRLPLEGDVEEEEDDSNLETDADFRSQSMTCLTSSSRNKRKNFQPRNIMYHQTDSEGENDLLLDYNCSVDEDVPSDRSVESESPCLSEPESPSASPGHIYKTVVSIQGLRKPSVSKNQQEGGDGPLDLSDSGVSQRKSGQFRCSAPVDLTKRVDDGALLDQPPDCGSAMDLSKGTRDSSASPEPICVVKCCPGATSFPFRRRDPTLPPGALRSASYGHGTKEVPDASLMKDYAETTMKELLGIYGLNDMVDSITKHVPLHNFSSGKILESMTVSQLPCMVSLGALPPNRMCTSNIQIHHSPEHMCSEQSGHVEQESTPSEEQPNQSAVIPCSTDGCFEPPHSTDTVSTIASLPPENFIGNPRVILPQNMATILSLAGAWSKNTPNQQPSKIVPTSSSQSSVSVGSVIPTSPISTHNQNVLVGSSTPLSLKMDQPKSGLVDYTRYVKRFANAAECGSNYCKDLNYREHFHCLDCNSRVFIKKEEMIRHFKWHKKRDESLQHGFMRYSPMDDCSDKFVNCSHNHKQTHYHCLKDGCDKVYISTSDVQMHANYHRKDSAIIQEGFQRFRATEDCGTSSCAFFGQRTTHFHCRRSGCSFTFKNKADMEKHKSYHIKDEQLNKDGFKKFMKHEHCSFENCRFSRVCNHIHCIRPGCTYVLHSSGQLYSHKRKHERRENELAYRKFKLAQSMMKSLSESAMINPVPLSEQMSSGDSSSSPGSGMNPMPVIPHLGSGQTISRTNGQSSGSGMSGEGISGGEGAIFPDTTNPNMSDSLTHSFARFTSMLTGVNFVNPSSVNMNVGPLPHGMGSTVDERVHAMDLSSDGMRIKQEDFLHTKKYLVRYTASDPCKPDCEYLYKDHFHCVTDNCDSVFKSSELLAVREHACIHEQQDHVTESFYTVIEPGRDHNCLADCPYRNKERHYHCGWEGCREIVSGKESPFRRLDHYKIHEYSRKLSFTQELATISLATSVDGVFKRKRGRPPKNRVIEFSLPSMPSHLPQAIYTSFKLPKPGTVPQQPTPRSFPSVNPSTAASIGLSRPVMNKSPVSLLPPPPSPIPLVCPSSTPVISLAGSETSVSMPVITMATNVSTTTCEQNEADLPPLVHPATQPLKIEVQEGFFIFPENTLCPDQLCPFHRQYHFHCTQPRCYYVTDRSDILLLHSKDFHDNIDIMEGFVFFDRSVDCRLPGCHSNKVNRHFHCTRPDCNYSFVRYSTMSMHEQKHRDQANLSSLAAVPKKHSRPSVSDEEAIPSSSPSVITANSGIISSINLSSETSQKNVVKASGTFYPLSAFTASSGPPRSSSVPPDDNYELYRSELSPASSTTSSNHDQPLTKLLQQPGPSPKNAFQGSEKHILYGPSQNCGRPFCKLKKRDHFHCNICNQAFSNFFCLKPHVLKHSGAMSPVPVHPSGSEYISPTPSSQSSPRSLAHDEEDGEPDDGRSDKDVTDELEQSVARNMSLDNTHCEELPEELPKPHDPHIFTWHSTVPQNFVVSSSEGSESSTNISFAPRKISVLAHSQQFYGSPQVDFSTTHDGEQFCQDNARLSCLKRNYSDKAEDSSETKRMKIPSLRILKDEPVPEGYIRYRFNEDCGYPHCGYREHQTHFHCMRKDCGYSFCDKTRFVQHTARHERLDTLMGGDFQQYRANVNCGRADCMYTNTLGAMANKSSHFHCLKCDFVCTDTNKVVAHRRQHAKMDSINAAGFEKFTPSQKCNIKGCNHNQRQTHYHCLKCQYAVLGLSQMSAHKYRHME